MSAPRPRSLVTVSGLTLALALATPTAAFATTEERGGNERSQQAQQENEQRKASPSPAPASGGSGSQSGSSSGSAPKAQESKTSEGKKAERSKSGQGANDEGRAAGGDPRGNNGTVKVHELGNTSPGNQPHVGCEFQIDFYGFDAGDTATITFTGHAPTGGGLLHSESGTLISADAAGGGQDHDATLVYSVSDELAELLAVAPHPQQGWHVKLAVDVDGAPGGAKQKVFWIDCPTAPAVAGTTEQPATGGGGTEVVTGAGDPDLVVGSQGTRELAPTFGGGSLGAATTSAVAGSTLSAATVATGVTGSRTAATGATVSARGATAPQALPFTGVQGLLGLLSLGLGALGAGGVAHRLGRTGAHAAR